jgi:hypothetical protein
MGSVMLFGFVEVIGVGIKEEVDCGTLFIVRRQLAIKVFIFDFLDKFEGGGWVLLSFLFRHNLIIPNFWYLATKKMKGRIISVTLSPRQGQTPSSLVRLYDDATKYVLLEPGIVFFFRDF